MSQDTSQKLGAVLHECDVHAARIAHAREVCGTLFPLTPASYQRLSDDDVAYVDQLIYRYTKLQDALGSKLFPMIVAHLREDAASMTVLDKLAHLERAGAIESAEHWQELRELRNQLAHEYEDDAKSVTVYLNELFDTSAELLSYHAQANRFVRSRILPA